MFSRTSRYHSIEVAKYTTNSGRQVAYLRRRFLPPATTAILTEHLLVQGDRLDIVTARYLGDPEQFWRVCDANNAMHPDELTAEPWIGQRLRIPLIQGGMSNA